METTDRKGFYALNVSESGFGGKKAKKCKVKRKLECAMCHGCLCSKHAASDWVGPVKWSIAMIGSRVRKTCYTGIYRPSMIP